MRPAFSAEKQLTCAPCGHILTNTGVWSPDSEWIVYDTRSDPTGDVFDGRTIEAVQAHTGEVRTLYTAEHGACCGVATFCPTASRVVFILGPENPTADWSYNAYHRQGVLVDFGSPATRAHLDARDLTPPFTPGALRGGSHVHVFSSDGKWVSFTYEDHVLAQFPEATTVNDVNLRGIGVSVPVGPVCVTRDHPRNHDGQYFTVLVTRTTAHPTPGSDQVKRALEEGWVGQEGYLRSDGIRQRRALAFQGHVITAHNETISEVFVVDLPDDVTQAGDGPLCGSANRAPSPPKGCVQRRLTYTADRRFPGIQGPRHWLRSSPDGSRIAFLMKDDEGVVQIWLVSPNGGTPRQLTHNPWNVASAFTWSADGQHIAHVMDNSVFVTDPETGKGLRLTPRATDAQAPRPEACVFSPDGRKIAFVRRSATRAGVHNQIFTVELSP